MTHYQFGFIKRAMEYGLNETQAVTLYKQADMQGNIPTAPMNPGPSIPFENRGALAKPRQAWAQPMVKFPNDEHIPGQLPRVGYDPHAGIADALASGHGSSLNANYFGIDPVTNKAYTNIGVQGNIPRVGYDPHAGIADELASGHGSGDANYFGINPVTNKAYTNIGVQQHY